MKRKYYAKTVTNQYGKFDSETEFNRYLHLKHLEDVGKIRDLQRQVRFEIIPKLIKNVEVQLKTKVKVVQRVEEQAAHYTCDFTYIEKGGKYIIEEQKSQGTLLARDYPLRKKLIKQIIHKHNEEVGFEDWEFREILPPPPKRKRKSK